MGERSEQEESALVMGLSGLRSKAQQVAGFGDCYCHSPPRPRFLLCSLSGHVR
jgi:hypothetical protein